MKNKIFKIVHQLYDKSFFQLYNQYLSNEKISYEEHVYKQEEQLNKMINFAYINIPFYNKLFKTLGLIPSDIKTKNDLMMLPIINKDIIKKNWKDFTPLNIKLLKYHNNSTGGTSGNPLLYRVSKEQRTRMLISLYRGWGYAGYSLGDKIVIFGGTSIGVGKEFNLKNKLMNFSRNIIALSAYDLDNSILQEYIKIINNEKPQFIRSFPSAIFFLSKWIRKNNIKIHTPKAIFTTSEKLYPDMRVFIESVFETKIFDNYGLNDGGLTAFECEKHNGMHIDYENSIFEVIYDGKIIKNGEGKAIATSLYNYSFPFLRYETGDIVRISDKECDCGRKPELITEIISRSVDFFITPNQRYIHGWFFYIIMESHSEGVDKYQIVQKDYNKIEVKLVVNEKFKKETGIGIVKLIREKEAKWNVELTYVDNIETTKAGKFKFIVNEILTNQ